MSIKFVTMLFLSVHQAITGNKHIEEQEDANRIWKNKNKNTMYRHRTRIKQVYFFILEIWV